MDPKSNLPDNDFKLGGGCIDDRVQYRNASHSPIVEIGSLGANSAYSEHVRA